MTHTTENSKEVKGFDRIHAHDLKAGQFFFFPNGKKRMVAEEVKTGVAITTIKATSPTGRTYTKEMFMCKLIYVYQ